MPLIDASPDDAGLGVGAGTWRTQVGGVGTPRAGVECNPPSVLGQEAVAVPAAPGLPQAQGLVMAHVQQPESAVAPSSLLGLGLALALAHALARVQAQAHALSQALAQRHAWVLTHAHAQLQGHGQGRQ